MPLDHSSMEHEQYIFYPQDSAPGDVTVSRSDTCHKPAQSGFRRLAAARLRLNLHHLTQKPFALGSRDTWKIA